MVILSRWRHWNLSHARTRKANSASDAAGGSTRHIYNVTTGCTARFSWRCTSAHSEPLYTAISHHDTRSLAIIAMPESGYQTENHQTRFVACDRTRTPACCVIFVACLPTLLPHAADVVYCNLTKQEENRTALMRPTAMGALVLMACGLLMLSTTCQAGGIDENPRVRAWRAAHPAC